MSVVPSEPVDEALVSVDEATREFGIARSTLYGWIKAGDVRPYKLPGDRRTYLNRQEIRLAIRLSKMGPKRPWRG